MTDQIQHDLVANHHADHAGFSGLGGYLMSLTMLPRRASIGRLAARLTDVAAGDHVVDVGCGPGAITRVAARLGARVTGVDPSNEMLNVARWTTRGITVDWKVGGAEALPVDDGDADVVWAVATVHHWPDLAGGLAEVIRVLRPDGRFVAVEKRTQPGSSGLASHGWTDAQAERFALDCTGAGLVDVIVSTHGSERGRVAVSARRP